MRFVDTNILVYAEQPHEGDKHEAACRSLRDIWERRDGVVSPQVLQELFVTITRKADRPYSQSVAMRVVKNYLAWKVVPLDGPLVVEAMELQAEAQLSYWDAAIVAAAVRGGATELLSEDLSDGQTIRGVRIRNPLV